MRKISDQHRAEVIAEYRRSGITQAEACQAFTEKTGIPLSERTLRSWLSVGARPDVDSQVLGLKLQALRQRLSEVMAQVEALIAGIEVAEVEELDECSEVEASDGSQAAMPVPTASMLATPQSTGGAEISQSAVPVRAGSAEKRDSVTEVMPVAAGPVPIGRQVEPTASLRRAKNTSFWDDP